MAPVIQRGYVLPAGLMRTIGQYAARLPEFVTSVASYWSCHYDGIETVYDSINQIVWEDFWKQNCPAIIAANTPTGFLCSDCAIQHNCPTRLVHGMVIRCHQCKKFAPFAKIPASECAGCLLQHWESRKHLLTDLCAVGNEKMIQINQRNFIEIGVGRTGQIVVDAFTTRRFLQNQETPCPSSDGIYTGRIEIINAEDQAERVRSPTPSDRSELSSPTSPFSD